MIWKIRITSASLALFLVTGTVGRAQPSPAVMVEALRSPDIFSTAAQDTGLKADLWTGTSADIARTIVPLLAQRSLSPASQGLAYRLMATGAPAPAGAEHDLDLAAARGLALIALGDAAGAGRVLDRQPGMSTNAELSRAAAEAALFLQNNAEACQIAQQLTQGREGVYWLRLRSFCQLVAGETEAAQLTFNLAQMAAKDTNYGRLMAAQLAGSGPPAKPAFKTGLERALSKAQGADLPPLPAPATVTETPDTLALLASTRGNRAAFDQLFVRASAISGKEGQSMRGAVLVLLATGATLRPEQRASFSAFNIDRSTASAARLTAMSMAALAGLKGETGLLALSIAAEAGSSGPGAADRAAIILALRRVGLNADAEAFASEFLSSLPGTSPPVASGLPARTP